MQPTTKQPGRRNSEYADPYEESSERVDHSSLSAEHMGYHTYDITYPTPSGTKTVRVRSATQTTRIDTVPDHYAYFWDDGRRLAYSPTDHRLVSLERDGVPMTLAQGDGIDRIEKVTYPPGAPVCGAIQTGVDATVYYRSARTGTMQEMEMHVRREEAEGWRLTGKRLSDGSRVEVHTRGERDTNVRHYPAWQTLGKTARVEMPRGCQYTVDVENLPVEKGDDYADRIKSAIEGISRHDSVDVTVTNDGELSWE
jgi:hypothetical protein